MEGSKPGTHHLGQSSTRQGFPGGPRGKEAASQCRSCKGHGVDPWVGKIPWRRTRQPTPVFLPGASHGQKSLAGYSPRGCKESDSMRAWQSRLGVSLVFRQVGSLRSGSRESIMTSSRLNAAAGGRYLPFTSEAAEAPCLVDDLTKTPQATDSGSTGAISPVGNSPILFTCFLCCQNFLV